MTKDLVVISQWMDKAEAQALVKTLIAEGKYAKGQLKLSSYRWVDPKDHSKGYLARVYAKPGICPEMELGKTGRVKKTASTTTGSALSSSEATLNMVVNFTNYTLAEVTSSTGDLAA